MYKLYFDHFNKSESITKAKFGTSWIFYNLNNKYYLMDSIR